MKLTIEREYTDWPKQPAVGNNEQCYLPEITGNKGSMLTICYPNNISASDQGNDIKRYQNNKT